jgi:uncharacterized membrane protein YraQ (UPF0718 family)/copper chaperone CopZ
LSGLRDSEREICQILEIKIMIDLLYDILKASVDLWLAVAPYLLLGLLIAGILHVFLGSDFIAHHLGKGRFASILKATVLGIPLPLCSCGVIPVAASLRKEGATKSATLAFLVSTPTTGVDSIAATYSLMGPLFAIFRPVAAFFSGILIGLLNALFNPEKETKHHMHDHGKISTRFRIKEVFQYGFVELAEDIGKWLLFGVLIGGILTVVIPEDLILRYFANPLVHFVIMLLIAIPLYVCATGSIPIAAALIQKGFAPGAALVFLIAGPATNTVTLSFVFSKLGKKAFYFYLSSIIVVSIVVGWLFNLLWYRLGGDIAFVHHHSKMLPPVLTITSGVLLLIFILRGLIQSRKKVVNMQLEWSVKDMTCKHCQMTVKNAVESVSGVETVVVDLGKKVVGVDGNVSVEAVEKAIQNAGYTPEELKK